MFDKIASKDDIQSHFKRRKNYIKDLSNLSISDKEYLIFLKEFQEVEITPDIMIFGYEDALQENKYVAKINSSLSEKIWMIGRTGQGDEWFIDKINGVILFYDHNKGDYDNCGQFESLDINFENFIKMAFLFNELENELDQDENISKKNQEKFKIKVNSIKENLYDLYPFKYF